MTCSFSLCLPLQNFSIQKINQSSGNYSNSYALQYSAVCTKSRGGGAQKPVEIKVKMNHFKVKKSRNFPEE